MEQVHFIQTIEQDAARDTLKARLGRLLADALQILVASELLLWSFLQLLGDEFPDWRLETGGFWMIQAYLLLTIVLFGIVVPLAGRYWALAGVGLEAGLILLGARRVLADRDLKGGLLAMYEQYLDKWNVYYHTNLYVSGRNQSELGLALFVIALLLLLMLLLLHYVAFVRWPLLLLPLIATGLGLLVDALPDWRGLALFFAATIMLYAGAGSFSRYRVLPAHARDRRGVIRWRLGTMLFAALVSFAVLAVTPRVFGSTVEHIPEKMQDFLAIQKKLETKLASIRESLIASDRAYVDNSTPKYRDKLVLEIAAAKLPETNLYLADFYSGDYRDGKWLQNNRNYKQAAAEDSINADQMGLFLRQLAYDNAVNGSEGRRAVDLGNIQEYRIDYKIFTGHALVPYFSDLSGADVWVEDEGTVKKRYMDDSLQFWGGGKNLNVLAESRYVWASGDLAIQNRVAELPDDAINWYSAYARKNYVKESGVSAVHKQARWLEYEDSVVIGDMNTYRLAMAKRVQNQLDKLADYNLYLDDIPAGTDTIQYFLETGHEGYCMHFASAGALILQELGVPARYASGYIVKRYAFKWDSDAHEYRASVYDRNGHAWVEVYLDGIGWVPCEMTPGYDSTENSLQTEEWNQSILQNKHERKENLSSSESSENASQSEDTETDAGTEEASEIAESSPTEQGQGEGTLPQDGQSSSAQGMGPVPASGTGGAGSDSAGPGDSVQQNKRGFMLRMAALVSGSLLLLLLAWLGICMGVRRYHMILRQEIRRKQHRRAVQRINQRIYRRLPKGVLQHSMTDADYENRLVRAYPAVSTDDWKQYMQIVKKVAFSREAVSDEEMRHCLWVYRTRRKKAVNQA